MKNKVKNNTEESFDASLQATYRDIVDRMELEG